jgi:glycosyltransferase involved in cell wall biosynthesis
MVNGLIYEPNHEDLGEQVDYLVKNPELMRKFAKRNREISVECFDIDIWREKWRKIIIEFGG